VPTRTQARPKAQKREGVQRIRQGGDEDIKERPQQVGVTGGWPVTRVHERRQGPQRRDEHERGEREGDRVAVMSFNRRIRS